MKNNYDDDENEPLLSLSKFDYKKRQIKSSKVLDFFNHKNKSDNTTYSIIDKKSEINDINDIMNKNFH